MGAGDSKCSILLEQMGWKKPEFIGEFHNDSLTSFLESSNLEVVLPRHAPQMDISCEKKTVLYPRPSFCWEAYKMHLGLIGPSTACRNQVLKFLPKIVDVFKGPPARMGPGREALPYYFLDENLHRAVLWDLPEINWKQKTEDYVRELGLLYFDCVFMLFSDKYLLSDIYCKMCVTMAVHGIPFFVICTTDGDMDPKAEQKLKGDFQRKDIQVRMFNPSKPHSLLSPLMTDFFKEISWNRSGVDKELTGDVNDNILGQTVRLKNIESKPELNGRAGVCIGYDKEKDRYRIRIITAGVESDLALKQNCVSILKPKLLNAMVQIKGLESRPELNGRYGFVDEFLRENERYRVFIPDTPGHAHAIALKAANLERVDRILDAEPVKPSPAVSDAKAKPKPKSSTIKPSTQGAKAKSAAQPQAASAKASSTAPATAAPVGFDRPAAEKPVVMSSPPAPKSTAATAGFDRPAAQKPAAPPSSNQPRPAAAAPTVSPSTWRGPATPSSTPAVSRSPPAAVPAAPAATTKKSSPLISPAYPSHSPPKADEDDDFGDFLPKIDQKQGESDDLMSRIFAAECDLEDETDEDEGPTASAPSQAPPASTTRPSTEISRKGLFGQRVWAIVGDPDVAEDLIDHLMDCGRTVFNVDSSESSTFKAVGDLNKDPSLPRADVLAFIDGDGTAVEKAINDALAIGIKGVILHPSAEDYGAGVISRCRAAGLVVHGADILEEITPGEGLA